MTDPWKPWTAVRPDDGEVLVVYPNQGNVMKLVSFNHVHGFWESKGQSITGIENQGCYWMSIPKFTLRSRQRSSK